jgi:hypothetical protein
LPGEIELTGARLLDIVFKEAVCDIMRGSSPVARKPSAGTMPGRCGFSLAADTHRPLFFEPQRH